MTKISALQTAVTAAVLGGAAAAASISAAASGPQATSPKTHPLPTAHVVQQDPSCKGYKTYGVPRVASLDARKTYTAVMTTNKGVITLALDARHAPNTVSSFIFLADHHYFDGVSFHRVIPGFVIQGGDPTGSGLCGPGYEFGDENLNQKYVRGSLAMANAGAATNGSQFFIVLADQTNGLDQQPNYSLFGHVVSGLKAMDAIASVRLGPGSDNTNSKPLQKVYMKTVRIVVH